MKNETAHAVNVGGATWTATPAGGAVPRYSITPTAGRQADWRTSKAWADGFWPEVKRVILAEVLPKIATVTIADFDTDAKRCTDYLITVNAGRIGCRIRSARYWQYADLTLRVSRPSGKETEVAKLHKGYVDWYFAGWGDDGQLTAWALIDVDRMLPLLDHPRRVYVNRTDGVQFMAVSLTELSQAGAITCAGGLAAGYARSERT
jgi:hypothetical protein